MCVCGENDGSAARELVVPRVGEFSRQKELPKSRSVGATVAGGCWPLPPAVAAAAAAGGGLIGSNRLVNSAQRTEQNQRDVRLERDLEPGRQPGGGRQWCTRQLLSQPAEHVPEAAGLQSNAADVSMLH